MAEEFEFVAAAVVVEHHVAEGVAFFRHHLFDAGDHAGKLDLASVEGLEVVQLVDSDVGVGLHLEAVVVQRVAAEVGADDLLFVAAALDVGPGRGVGYRRVGIFGQFLAHAEDGHLVRRGAVLLADGPADELVEVGGGGLEVVLLVEVLRAVHGAHAVEGAGLDQHLHVLFVDRVHVDALQEVEDVFDLGIDAHLRQRARVTGEL